MGLLNDYRWAGSPDPAPAAAPQTPGVPYGDVISAAADRYGVPADALMRIASVESGFNPNAVGQPTQWGRARGLFQFLDSTARGLGIDPMDPAQAADGAARMFADNMKRFGSVEGAVAAHFAGPDTSMWGPKTAQYVRDVLGRDLSAPSRKERANPFADDLAAVDEIMRGLSTPPRPAETPAADDTQSTGAGGDAWRLFKAGGAQTLGAIPRLADLLTGGAIGKDTADGLARYAEDRLSETTPDTRAAMAKQWLSDEPDKLFGDAWSDWRSYAAGVVQNLPSFLPGLGTTVWAVRAARGAAATDAALAAGRAMASGATREMADAAAASAFKATFQREATRLATRAGMATEGVIGSGQNAEQARGEIMGLSAADLMALPEAQALAEDGKDENAIREELARRAMKPAAALGGLADAAFGGVGDRVLARLMTGEGGTFLRRFATGFAGEAGEEAAQSAGEQIGINVGLQQTGMDRGTFAGVGEQAVGGAIIGGLMGGGVGGLLGSREAPLVPETQASPPQPAAIPGGMTDAEIAAARAGLQAEQAQAAQLQAMREGNDAAQANPLALYNEAGDWRRFSERAGPGQTVDMGSRGALLMAPTGRTLEGEFTVDAGPLLPPGDALSQVMAHSAQRVDALESALRQPPAMAVPMLPAPAPVAPAQGQTQAIPPEAVDYAMQALSNNPAITPKQLSQELGVPGLVALRALTAARKMVPPVSANQAVPEVVPPTQPAPVNPAPAGAGAPPTPEVGATSPAPAAPPPGSATALQTPKGAKPTKPGKAPAVTSPVPQLAPIEAPHIKVGARSSAPEAAPAPAQPVSPDDLMRVRLEDGRHVFVRRPPPGKEIQKAGFLHVYNADGTPAGSETTGNRIDETGDKSRKHYDGMTLYGVGGKGFASADDVRAEMDRLMLPQDSHEPRRMRNEDGDVRWFGMPKRDAEKLPDQFDAMEAMRERHSGKPVQSTAARRAQARAQADAEQRQNDAWRAGTGGSATAPALQPAAQAAPSEAGMPPVLTNPASKMSHDAVQGSESTPNTQQEARDEQVQGRQAQAEVANAKAATPAAAAPAEAEADPEQSISTIAAGAKRGLHVIPVDAYLSAAKRTLPAGSETIVSIEKSKDNGATYVVSVGRGYYPARDQAHAELIIKGILAARDEKNASAKKADARLVGYVVGSLARQEGAPADIIASVINIAKNGTLRGLKRGGRMPDGEMAGGDDLKILYAAGITTAKQLEDAIIAERERMAARNAGQQAVPSSSAPAAAPETTTAAAPAPATPPDRASTNTLITDAMAEAARARLKSKLGRLNTGIDPEMLADGAVLAAYHIERGFRSFAAYSAKMIEDMGEAVRPYLRAFYEGARHFPGFDAEGMTSYAELEKLSGGGTETGAPNAGAAMPELPQADQRAVAQESPDAAGSRADLERDRRDAGPGDAVGAQGVQAGAAGDGGPAGRGVPEPAGEGRPAADRSGDVDGQTLDVGGAGHRWLSDGSEPAGPVVGAADRGDAGGGRATGGAGVQPDADSGQAAVAVATAGATQPADLAAKRAAQVAAQDVAVVPKDPDNIRAALPFLTDGQRDDVLFAEQRFDQPDGYGVLFTNGTGTGKTYTSLGIVKRFERAGRTNILIVVPSQTLIDDYVAAGKNLLLDVKPLDGTRDNGGSGPVITTYAAFGQNDALAGRAWDLIVTDESQNLSQAADGSSTNALEALRALALHPDGSGKRAKMLHPGLYEAAVEAQRALRKNINPAMQAELQAQADQAHAAWGAAIKRVEAEVKSAQGAARSRVVMLSATPFAYRENIQYADGFLLNFEGSDTTGGYNAPKSGFNKFMVSHFGYRMRYGKLTKPEAAVNIGLLETELNARLRRSGALSWRGLAVDADYDRKFLIAHDAIGTKIDEGRAFLRADAARFGKLRDTLNDRFNYLAQSQLLEAIKAKAAIPYIRASLDAGRKVVVFHNYNVGGAVHPFRLPELETIDGEKAESELAKQYRMFKEERPDLYNLDLTGLVSPIDALTRAFPEALLFNGTVSSKTRTQNKALFNADDGQHRIIIVQSDAGGAGLSLHDTTGKFQRVLLNLGLPVRPVTAIQQEGRIYRMGVMTDAIIRYMATGTIFERIAFAQKIAERSSTVENLAMGSAARDLKRAFIDAFQDARKETPSADDGKGGKAADRAIDRALTPFDKAKTHYFAQMKKAGRRDQREGFDYFPTPEPVGLKMVEWLRLKANDSALEPSAGHGAIARYFPEDVRATAVEPSADLASRLAMAMTGRVITGRFEDLHVTNKYDGIAMNPPFGKGGKLAVEHLAKAATHLNSGGRIVALLPRGPSADKRFDQWYESDEAKGFHLVADITMPAVLFERAGTGVSTRIVIIDRSNDPAQQRNRDLSSAETIGELFDRLQDMEMPPRSPAVSKADARVKFADPDLEAARQAARGDARLSMDAAARDLADGDVEGAAMMIERAQRQTASGEFHEASAGAADAVRAMPALDRLGIKVTPTVTASGKAAWEVSGKTFEHKDAIKAAGGKWYGPKKVWTFYDGDPTEELSRALDDGAGSDAARYSRVTSTPASATPAGRGLPLTQARRVADAFARRLGLAPDRVVVLGSAREIGAPEGYVTKGAYDAQTGTVYLFADALGGAEDARRVLLHEAVGHLGVRAAVGDGWAQVRRLLEQGRARDRGIADLFERVAREESAALDADAVADEVIGRAAERYGAAGPLHWRRILGAIRAALRRLGLVRDGYSLNEVVDLLAAGRQAVRMGGAPVEGGALAYSRAVTQAAQASGRQPLMDKAAHTIKRMRTWLADTGPLSSLPQTREYLQARYRTLGKIADVDEIAKGINAAFAPASDAGKEQVYRFLTTKGASAAMIADAKVRAEAVRVKRMISEVGQRLVDRGMLPQEVYEANDGGYLPRVYLRHVIGESAFAALGTGRKPSSLGYLKARQDIPEEVRRLVLGEITDPGFLAARGWGVQMRDIAILDWIGEIAKNRAWVLDRSLVQWQGKRVTPYWLKDEAARIRVQSAHYTEANRTQARQLADKMDDAANAALSAAEGPEVPDGYKQMPKSARYGALRGMVVRQEIYDDIVGSMQADIGDKSMAERILGNGGLATKLTQLWKWGKVAANPPAQIRNFLSNGIMLHLSGVPFHRVPQRIVQAIREIRTNGHYWQVAKRYGVTESTFAAQELFRIERDLLEATASRKGGLSFDLAKLWAGRVMDWTGDVYQLSEAVFKTAKIIDAMQRQKMGEADAALEAQKWLFDYSLVSPSVRYLRNAPVGAPFLTFYVKAIPRLAEVALTHPLRFAPYVAIPYVLAAMLASMTDTDDDDVEALKRALPQWLQDRGNAWILPAKDENGRWQALDVSYFMPWSMLTQFASAVVRGDAGEALSTSGLLGGPLPDMIAAIKTNKDPFTQKPIANPADPAARQIGDIMLYAWRMAMPTFITDIGAVGHLYRALANENLDRYGEPKSTVTQAAARLFGANVYPINPEHTREQNLAQMQREIADTRRLMRQKLRDPNLDAEQRAALREEYAAEIRRRYERLRDYARESRVHPNLRTGTSI